MIVLDNLLLGGLVGPLVMVAEFNCGITSALLAGGSGGGMLGGASSSGSELANSGGGGMKEMESMPLYCPDGDAILVGFFVRMMECAEGSGLKLVTFRFSVLCLDSRKRLGLPGDTGSLGVTVNEFGLVSL